MTTTIVTIGIWPGEAKLTAPFLCPDGQPDAFVVSDTYQTEPGETSTNFTLYCVGERGDATDVGFLKPAALLTLVHGALWVILIFPLAVTAGRKRSARMGIQPSIPMTDDQTTAESAVGADALVGVSEQEQPPPDQWPITPENPIVSGAIDDDPFN